MRRGRMRIERQAPALAARAMPSPPDPAVTRDGGSVLLDGEEIDRYRGALHGIALDLGTSTVVLRLLDLATGEAVADTSFENPQRFAGSDVMARIQYAAEHGPEPLVRTLTGVPQPRDRGVSRRSGDDLRGRPSRATRRCATCSSGRTWVRSARARTDRSPRSSVLEGRRATHRLADTGRGCGLPIHPDARVYGLPVICGHVGADAAACLLATGLADEDRLAAVMDIGTNTEIIVGQPAPHRRGVVPGRAGVRGRRRRVRHARARGRRRVGRRSARTASSASASSAAARPRASAARGWSTC